MKKFLFLALSLFIFTACKDDEPEKNDYAELLNGTWVYEDYDTWEVMSFRPSGQFYYSNINTTYNFENENINGIYFIDEKGNITGNYTLNGVTQNLDITLESINDLEFTAKWNNTGTKFTYARLLDSESIDFNETVQPNYTNLLRGKEILAYISRNNKIATVNDKNGEITGVGHGRTYIDIATKTGTAVIEIIVNGIIPHNYDEFIGADREKIYDTFGTIASIDDDDSICYQESDISDDIEDNIAPEFKNIYFQFDTWSEKVNAISLYFNENINEELLTNINNYFGEIYTIYSKGTTSTQKAFINNENYEDATVGIVLNLKDKYITYVSLESRLLKDYTKLLGKSQSKIKELMGSDYFELLIEDDFLFYIYNYNSVVTNETINDVFISFSNNTASACLVTLADGIDSYDISKFLSKKYIYLSDYSDSSIKFYMTEDALFYILYTPADNTITYSVKAERNIKPEAKTTIKALKEQAKKQKYSKL